MAETKKIPINEKLLADIKARDEKRVKKTNTVKSMTGSKAQKYSAISGRIISENWNLFQEINRRKGISSNSALNLMISQYIQDNRNLLD